MGSKVSMVIACYNKAEYIGSMLESVERQLWDNIEVIIVNDGSTDNSKAVIAQWESRLFLRGYKVIVVDQENGGVAAALKAGLARAGGDYVCLPDADDELLPEYVSEMAGMLDDNRNLDFIMCDLARIKSKGEEAECFFEDDLDSDETNILERYLLQKFDISVYRYLFRRSYLQKVGLPDNMITMPKGTQEPQIMIPVFGGGGKFAKVCKVLYIYNAYYEGLASKQKKNPISDILGNYHQLQLKTIALLNVSEQRKLKLASIARMGMIILCNNCLTMDKKVVNDFFVRAITNKILGTSPQVFNISGCIIAYGSLGKSACKLLPKLKDTPLWPDLFWDKAANGISTVFGGSKVTTPQPELIKQGDIILCFPVIKLIIEEARNIACEHGATVMTVSDILDWIAEYCYS